VNNYWEGKGVGNHAGKLSRSGKTGGVKTENGTTMCPLTKRRKTKPYGSVLGGEGCEGEGVSRRLGYFMNNLGNE